MKTYADYNREIEGRRAIAKKLRHITDHGLGELCETSGQGLRNLSCKHSLPDMSFWQVVQLVRASGGDVEIK